MGQESQCFAGIGRNTVADGRNTLILFDRSDWYPFDTAPRLSGSQLPGAVARQGVESALPPDDCSENPRPRRPESGVGRRLGGRRRRPLPRPPLSSVDRACPRPALTVCAQCLPAEPKWQNGDCAVTPHRG